MMTVLNSLTAETPMFSLPTFTTDVPATPVKPTRTADPIMGTVETPETIVKRISELKITPVEETVLNPEDHQTRRLDDDLNVFVPKAVLPPPMPDGNVAGLDEVELSDVLTARYAKLFQDGFLVNLHVSVWGMQANLDEKDLTMDKKVSDLFKLGKKMLIEPKHLNEFKNAESKARRYLYKNSYDFPIADAHFVPKLRVADVLTKLEEFKNEFNTLVATFIANYDTYKQEVLDRADYKDIKEGIAQLQPAKEELKKKFGFSTTIFKLGMPAAFDELNTDAIKAQLKGQNENSMGLLSKFAQSAAISLRERLITMCTTIIEKIDGNELISKANLNTINEEIANFRALNFLGDSTIEKELVKLETLVNGKNDFKKDKEVIGQLSDALTNVLTLAENVSDIQALSGKYFNP